MPAYASPLSTKDTQLHGDLDQVETLLAAIRDFVDTLETKLSPPLLVELDTEVQTDALTDTQLRAAPISMVLSEDTDVEVTSLPLPTGAAEQITLQSILAKLNAGAIVDLGVATPLAISNGAGHAATKYLGVSVAETTGTATAKIRVRDGSGGTILSTITLVASESQDYTFPRGRAIAGGAIYVEVVSGTVEGSVYYL